MQFLVHLRVIAHGLANLILDDLTKPAAEAVMDCVGGGGELKLLDLFGS